MALPSIPLIPLGDLAETGRVVPFEVSVASRSSREEQILLGRHRWMPGGRAIAFVGLDEDGRSGVFVQDFDPDKDTRASRRKLAGFDPLLLTESFAIAPDGSPYRACRAGGHAQAPAGGGCGGCRSPRCAPAVTPGRS